MTITTIPRTHADLEPYLPPKPTSGPLVEAERAASALHAAGAAAGAELEVIDAATRRDIADLAALVLAGSDVPQIETRDRALRRLELTARAEILDAASARCHSQANTLRQTDPAFLAWQERRQLIIAEWQQLRALPDEIRDNALARFVQHITEETQP